MSGKLTLEVHGGADINNTICEAIEIACKTGYTVEFQFNDVTIIVDGESKVGLLYRDWYRAMAGYIGKKVGPHPAAVLSQEEKDSDNRIRAEHDREREQRQKVREAEAKSRRDRVNARLAGAADIQIAEGQEETWKRITEKNGTSGIYHYAVRWARLMQVEIAAGKTVGEIQESTSHDADFESMSGATFGYAYGALKECWRYGDQLK